MIKTLYKTNRNYPYENIEIKINIDYKRIADEYKNDEDDTYYHEIVDKIQSFGFTEDEAVEIIGNNH